MNASRLRFALAALLAAGLMTIVPITIHAQAPFHLDIKNGAMTQGGTVPAEWTGKYGDVEVGRDTDTFKTGPASLRVKIADGKNGQAFQTVQGGAGATFKITGWMKTAGAGLKAQVMVQAFADGYKQNQFIQVRYIQGDSDWTRFEKEVTLPSWTAFFNVGVLAEGSGTVWIDEVHDASQPIDAGLSADDSTQWTKNAPDADKPTVPGWGYYPSFPQAWQNFHHSFLDRTKQGGINVVFLGDSITQGWGGGGKDIFEKRYAPLGTVNYGIGGDSTRQLLWRTAHGELDNIHPKLLVLMIGTNNLYSDFNAGTDQEIADGITLLVHTLRTKLPATRILLMGILPRQNTYFSNRIANINGLIKGLDNGDSIRFLDIGTKFATAPGVVKPEMFNTDQLHPVTAGYVVWADSMQPLFDSMLKAGPLKSIPAHTLKKQGLAIKKNNVRAHLPIHKYLPVTVAQTRGGWEALPMRTDAQAAAGISPGGEGCQYPQTIAVDSVQGSFILFGTDVGGIYRSVDSGKTFHPCMMGYFSIGSCGFAIDPVNINRCLSVGDNTGQDHNPYYKYDGIYLSTDRGANWKQVLPGLNRGGEKGREQIAFDPTSYDQSVGYCTRAYWCEEGNADEPSGRFFKSVDGGATWDSGTSGSAYSGGTKTALLKIAPDTGELYIAGDHGFFTSSDQGATWTKRADGNFTSLDVAPSRASYVWVTTADTLLRSSDHGQHFKTMTSSGTSHFYHLKVSPADPRQMVAANPAENMARYHSMDSGIHWAKSQRDTHLSWIPEDILYDDRCKQVAWNPVNSNIVWGIGPGDIITRSTDGGKTFAWANNGNNGIMTGGLFNFNAQDPDTLYIGSQDYNGSVTVNGGKTWKYVNLSKDNKHSSRPSGDDGDPWGWVYGGYAASPTIYFGGNRAYTESKYDLWITFDGGKTTERRAEDLHGAQVSIGSPTNPEILFCWDHRSTDRGQTWTKMTGCDGVFTSNPTGDHALYGRNGRDLVRSIDQGATWTVLSTLPTNIRDVAFDSVHDRAYAACDDSGLYVCSSPAYAPTNIRERLPVDQHGDQMMVSTVAIDPGNPSVVYAGANGTGLFIERDNGVARSVDSGETWEKLTGNPKFGTITGGQMASAIRVHPKTHYLYVGTDCYGFWKIAPPAAARTASAR